MGYTIVVILTPLQLKHYLYLCNQDKNLVPQLIFFYKKNISIEAFSNIEILKNATIIGLDHKQILFNRIIKHKFKELKRIKNLLVSFKTQIDKSIPKNRQINLVIGSEKDLFTQVLISAVYNQNQLEQLIALEEGSAYYRRMTAKDFIFKFLYKLLTPVIIGFKYHYFSTLGSHTLINKSYVRFPDLIPNKSDKIDYLKLEIPVEFADLNKIKKSRKILFLTAPFSEKGKNSIQRDVDIVKWVEEAARKFEYELYLKPHPREQANKYEGVFSNGKIIEKHIAAESLELDDFHAIIHFGSSLIFNLKQINYPFKKVITFNNLLDSLNLGNALKESIIVDLNCTQKDIDRSFQKLVENQII
ncbi:MAG: polysialyltransferase family glycosyltransferase [Fulvivirga sp.]